MTGKEPKLDLWKRLHRGDQQARQELILYYLPLVRFWVDRISKNATWASREDLMSEGTVGLIKAVERFDPEKGVDFSIFARHQIRGAIFDSLELTRGLTRKQAENYRKVRSAQDALETQLKRTPTIEEIAEEAKLTVEQIETTADAVGIAFPEESSESISLVVHGSRAGFKRLQDLLRSGELSSVAGATVEAIDWKEPESRLDTLLIQKVMSKLTERESIVLSLFYWEDRTDAEIAERLESNLSMVRRTRLRALKKVQSQLETRQE